jgi:hypothetical protein
MSAYRWLKPALISVLMSGILITTACIPTSPEFTVQFIIDDGIIGTPASGTYTYREFDEIPYKYTPSSDAVLWPIVYINGAQAKAEDTMMVYNYTTVKVRQIDIRNDAVNQDDQWQFTLYNKQGGEVTSFRLRFVGNSNTNGYFSDDRKNYYGTWVITESKKLTLTYLNWEDAVLVGDISTMTGVWTISSDPDALSWRASR